MSFKVNDLAVSLPGTGNDDTITCTTLTMTGSPCGATALWQAGRQRQLALLKAQLRNAMSRA
jgi:hypothetical protein